MPRNSSGTFSLPVAAFTAGTTIQSADVNSDFSDIASALTDSLSVSGKGGMSASLQGASGSLANPGYCFLSDVKTGMWLSGAHQIQFVNNGVAGLTLNSDTSASFPSNVTVTGVLAALGGVSGAIPAGIYVPYAGSTAPSGWLLCFGQSVTNAAYPDLFAAIGYTYGGAGANFNVPDLRGRTPVGLDNMGGVDAGRVDWANALGTTGGEQYHTLTTPEIPAHNHGVTDPGHAHSYTTAPNGVAVASGVNVVVGTGLGTYTTGGAATGITIQNTGGGGQHNNMPPGIISTWIIKT